MSLIWSRVRLLNPLPGGAPTFSYCCRKTRSSFHRIMADTVMLIWCMFYDWILLAASSTKMPILQTLGANYSEVYSEVAFYMQQTDRYHNCNIYDCSTMVLVHPCQIYFTCLHTTLTKLPPCSLRHWLPKPFQNMFNLNLIPLQPMSHFAVQSKTG